MIKQTGRFVPDHLFVDECEPNYENAIWAFNDTKMAKQFADHYTQAVIVQAGGVEFKTLGDLYVQEDH